MKFIKLFSFILLSIVIQRFCHNQTDGFSMRKIHSNLSFHEEWEPKTPLHEDLKNIQLILNQPYRYLGKGAQSYVFASDDGKYVLKFFRHDHMRLEPWHFLLSADHRKNRLKISTDKLRKDFESYKIAYEKLYNETGLIYIHLNKTQHLELQIPLYDKIGIKHLINLDKMEFILQKRVELFFPSLEKWIAKGDVITAKKALTELISLLKKRFEIKIYDKDPDLNTNFGFLNGHPIQLDVGRFKRDSFYSNPQVYKREILRITDNLKQWLDVHSLELSSHLQEELRVL